ncbi:MAG: hypothetical protein ACK4UT_00780 [Moraxellaceae bacterium]
MNLDDMQKKSAPRKARGALRQAQQGMRRKRALAVAANLQASRELAGLDDLAALEGWGKLKKKLGLNKLKTRKLVGKVVKVIPGAALLAPSKDNLKAAGKGLTVAGAAAATVLTGGKALSIIKPALDARQQKKAAKAAASQAASGDLYQQYASAPGLPSDYLSVNTLAPADGAMTGQYLAKGEPDPSEQAPQTGGLLDKIFSSVQQRPLLWLGGGAVVVGGTLLLMGKRHAA